MNAKIESQPEPHNKFIIYLISSVAAIGGFLFGFDSGVINGTVSALQETFGSDSVGSGFNVSSMLLGCAAGAFIAGNLADKFGRRSIMFATALLFMLSAWGSGISSSSAEFVVYRVIGGLAVGAASVLCPAYISEIAPAQIRGKLASLQQVAIVLGLFFSFFSNYLIANSAGGAKSTFAFGFEAWQWMFWIELIPAGLFLISLFFIPESPRYLVAAGKINKAKSVLAKLSHADDSQEKLEEIESTLAAGHKPSMADLFDKIKGRIHPVLWIGIGLSIFQQLVGINVIFYYGSVLWQAAGFTESKALLINVIGGAVNVGSTLVATFYVDKWGRKPLLIAGSTIMAIFLGVMAFIFNSADVAANGDLVLGNTEGTIALIAANLFLVGFGISWGPVMWIMLGEMFPNKFRGAALAVTGFTQWVANFTVTMTFPILLANIGLSGAYSLYSIFSFISIIFVWKWVSETKGMTLEEM
ncbi:sugar porter family MFS transporter [Persicirhabdus sediminis]|uniref:Sugar porter family MFS transporter n=1 Tax=Persicirhabdus sediminis TaxID=454144 RepID=A0A8J7SLN6_9BACT|nr:sugar porter family MFS transporter [Persicirhabdus sediminis]MBK1792476.1 sugar porter family MFS transporter [Persicirhabdus sediminis]